MNRAAARNALSGPMMALMREAWDRVDADPGIRACVLTGAGGAFCSGADLKAMTRSHPGDQFAAGDTDLSVIEPLLKGRRLTKPLIATVEGPAVAGGTEILQATDIRVAGESARFGVAEARWGLFPLGGSAVRLPRQIPYTIAADLLLTGRLISAAEARDIGLIGHVVPDGQALARALGIGDLIAANGPVAVRAIRRSPGSSRCGWRTSASRRRARAGGSPPRARPRSAARCRSTRRAGLLSSNPIGASGLLRFTEAALQVMAGPAPIRCRARGQRWAMPTAAGPSTSPCGWWPPRPAPSGRSRAAA